MSQNTIIWAKGVPVEPFLSLRLLTKNNPVKTFFTFSFKILDGHPMERSTRHPQFSGGLAERLSQTKIFCSLKVTLCDNRASGQ